MRREEIEVPAELMRPGDRMGPFAEVVRVEVRGGDAVVTFRDPMNRGDTWPTHYGRAERVAVSRAKAERPHRVACYFCRRLEAEAKAAAGGWTPEFDEPGGDTNGPVCPDCTLTRLWRDRAGEYNRRAEGQRPAAQPNLVGTEGTRLFERLVAALAGRGPRALLDRDAAQWGVARFQGGLTVEYSASDYRYPAPDGDPVWTREWVYLKWDDDPQVECCTGDGGFVRPVGGDDTFYQPARGELALGMMIGLATQLLIQLEAMP